MDMYYLPELWSTIDAEASELDPFAHVADASNEHRDEHECDAYPSTHDAPLVAAIARASGARRILEVGCGLGYSALWLAHGGGPGAKVETIEKDATHRELAEATFRAEGFGDRIRVHAGKGIKVLAALEGPYDLIYADGDIGEYRRDLEHFERLLRTGGTLASANLYLDELHPEMPGAGTMKRYRKRLFDPEAWLTSLLPMTVGLAISVKL